MGTLEYGKEQANEFSGTTNGTGDGQIQANEFDGLVPPKLESTVVEKGVGEKDMSTDKPSVDNSTNNSSFLTNSLKGNILSEFENMAFNFRLYMTTEQATIESMSTENIIVIAETGSTGLNITEVSIDTIISPSSLTKSSFATNVNIKIIEPFGTGLMDYIRNAALELGIRDHRSSPVWLDLRFKGYTGSGEYSHEGGEPITLDGETRTWNIRVKNIEVEMNSGGTEYNLTCIAQNEAALEDAARRIPTDINIEAATVGDVFDEIKKSLNDSFFYDKVFDKDKVQNIREYDFKFPVYNNSKIYKTPVEEWKIRGGKNINAVRSAETHHGEGRIIGWKATFKKGMSIEEIIQEVIGSTEEGQSLLLFGETGRKIDDSNPRDPKKPALAFVTDPEVYITTYNAIAKTYNIKITYNIREYKTFIPIVTREQIEIAKRSGVSADVLNAKMKISAIQKKYDYMFTGENTEILDYNISMNSQWFVSLPIFKGQGRNKPPEEGLYGNSAAAKNRIQELKNAESKPDPNSTDGLLKKLKTLNEQQDKVRGFGGIDAIAARNIQTDIDVTQKEAIKKGAQLSISESNQLLNATSYSAETLAKRYTSLENDNVPTKVDDKKDNVNNKNNRGSIFFAEDFGTLSDSKVVRDRQEEYNKQINDVGAQVSATAANKESSIEGTDDEDRSFFSTIMNQVYGFKGQLIDLDLEIKGDPYWLGEPNIRNRLAGSNGVSDLTQGDSIIILSFLFPVSVDEDGSEHSYDGTGLYSLKRKENGFNGIYRIVSVVNSFSGGRFTQKLTGYIDPLTKEQDLIKVLERIDVNGI